MPFTTPPEIFRLSYGSRIRDPVILYVVVSLDVRAGIDCKLLSTNTEYRLVFSLKIAQVSYGWTEAPIKFSATLPYGEVC